MNGERLRDDDIVSILRTWTAGHGTVAAALGILTFNLAEHPEVQAQLRGKPSLLPAAIEEIRVATAITVIVALAARATARCFPE